MEVELARLRSRLVRELAAQLVVGEREHPAPRVPDDQRLLRSQQPVRDDERAQCVVGDEAARVADHVCVALLEAEELRGVETRVHARHDRESARRGRGQVTLRELRGVGVVGGYQLVANRHGRLTFVREALKLSLLK
jgi:hypothetical protein